MKHLCESRPNFYRLRSFIPVTSTDGRVFRNQYCAKCVSSTTRATPWQITHLHCPRALKLVFDGGVNDVLTTRLNLHTHVMMLVREWMSRHCRPRLEPHSASSFHFCDLDLEAQKRTEACDDVYDPVWTRAEDGRPLLFRNAECATRLRGPNATRHCLDQDPDDAVAQFLFDAIQPAEATEYQAYFPGSLTILLNFGPDGKMEVNMVDKDQLGRVNPCPPGSALETATMTCKKLTCPAGTILLDDGHCKRIQDVDRENVRFETHVKMALSVRYNTTIFPAFLIPAAEELLRVSFSKYLNIDEGGMLNFTVKARAQGKDENGDGAAEIEAFFDIDLELILEDESQNDVLIVQRMFDDFNRNLTTADRKSKAFKVTRIAEKITHLPVRDETQGNKTVTEDKGQEIDWCPNGDVRFYNGSHEFEYWQERVTHPAGVVRNETFVRTFDTDTVYQTGEFDLMIFVETDLMTNEEVLTQMVRVCQPHPHIGANHHCLMEVMLNKTEYRLLKNRSVEVYSDRQIYGIDEYEICPIMKLIPAKRGAPQLINAQKAPSYHFNKIIVCLRQGERVREAMFFTFSAVQGLITLILLPVSMVFLLATISIYIFFKKLRNLPGLILLHLTVSLLLSQSLILFSLNYDLGVSWSCTILAVVNHYLLLMSFCWMNTYAYNIYRTFATFTNLAFVRDFSVQKKMRKYCGYSYGLPALVVVACMIIDAVTGWMHYGGDNLIYLVGDEQGGNGTYTACWINNTAASVTFFGVPVLVMVIVNTVFYVLTVRLVKAGRQKMTTGRRVSAVSVNADSPVDLKTFMRLSSVMGFTWLLGYGSAFVKSIAVSSFGAVLQEIISFLFIGSTALQGVGIFCAFATAKRVKDELAEMLEGSRFDWSRRRGSDDSVSTVSSQIDTPQVTPQVKDKQFFQ